MERIGDRYVEASWDEAIGAFPDAFGACSIARVPTRSVCSGDGCRLSSPANLFLAGLMDAIGTRQRIHPGIGSGPFAVDVAFPDSSQREYT